MILLQGRESQRQRGMALLMVMVTIVFLGILAGQFATSMKVETRLGSNMMVDPELEWAGRSSIEWVRLLLSDKCDPEFNYDSKVELWAGGPSEDIDRIIDGLDGIDPMELKPPELVEWEVVDLERYFNINRADESILREALIVMGGQVADEDLIVNSIQDWMDPDDKERLSGAESDLYEGLEIPYYAKDGPIDDITELLLVNGVSSEMFWGPGGRTGRNPMMDQLINLGVETEDGLGYRVGFVDLFTALSDPAFQGVNANTASAEVLDMLPGIDELTAQDIVTTRMEREAEGYAGFKTVQEIVGTVPSLNAALVGNANPQSGMNMLGRMFTVKSTIFRATMTVEVGGHTARWVGIIRRLNQNQTEILSLYRDE